MNGSSILKMNCGSSPVNSDLNLQISDLRFELPRYLGDVCVYKKASSPCLYYNKK